MKKERRVIFRTEVFQRKTLRQSSKISDLAIVNETYRLTISRKQTDKDDVIVFDAEINGHIEIKEINEEFRLKRD